MNCNLTNEDRKKGMLCRSWGCQPCLEFGVSKNDLNIIKTHMQIMTLKEEIEQLKQQLEEITNKCAELNYDKNCLISDLNQIKENERQLKQQLEKYKSDYNDAYVNDLETLSVEQLRERIVLMHSWVKYHQCSIERKCKQYNDFKKEAVEVIEFYGDVKGENWGACRGDDTHETCCHMISEISGGDKARQFIAKYRGGNDSREI